VLAAGTARFTGSYPPACLARLASWPVLDRWLRRRGVKRLPYQPLRSLPQPEGIDTERWQQFVADWEYQAFGKAPGWGRWQLMRHLRALSIVRC